MSYDIHLVEPKTGQVVKAASPHHQTGGSYVPGDTNLWLNITWNYAPYFYRTLGPNGIRTIYGLSGAESIPLLQAAMAQLKDDTNADYWTPTEGNARAALAALVALAEIAPHAIWDGD